MDEFVDEYVDEFVKEELKRRQKFADSITIKPYEEVKKSLDRLAMKTAIESTEQLLKEYKKRLKELFEEEP